MLRLLYLSAASHPFSAGELRELLAKARAKNARLGVTGILLYRDGDFLQLLEGDEAAVRELFGVIAADARHTRVTLLLEESCTTRLFAEWSMAFRDLADPELATLPGFSPLLHRPLLLRGLKDHPEDAMQLVSVFAESGR